MNEVYNVVRILERAGLHVLGADADFIYLEDPSCILRGFENFVQYAWVALALITGGLIMGWGISMIRGAKNAITENFKSLILIFGILTAVGPILNLIYGGDLMGAGCKTTKVSINQVNTLLLNQPKNANTDSSLYEDIDIYDSGSGITAVYDIPEYDGEYDLDDEIVVSEPNTPSLSASIIGIASNSSGPMSVSAFVDARNPGEITYINPDGTRRTHIGGSLTWRANNPGAIRSSDFTKRMGQIGTTANGFAIFPNESVGQNAVVALLKTSKYQNKTIRDAIKIYAPSDDGNNPHSYAAKVARDIGVSVDTLMRNLSDNQLMRMVLTIRRIEGWRAGNIK